MLLPFLILTTLCLADEVHVVVPSGDDMIFWSDPSSWKPFPPSSSSFVYVDGGDKRLVLVVDTSPLLYSLHLSNVALVVDVENVEIPGNLTCKDAAIESSTQSEVGLTTTGFEVDGRTELVNVNLVFAELYDYGNELILINSKAFAYKGDEHSASSTDSEISYDELLAWGDDEYGQTGTGDPQFFEPRRVYRPIPVVCDEKFTQIVGGHYHTLAITSKGTLFAWGWNRFGQLGLNHTEDQEFPVQVEFLSNVVQIAAGRDFSLARLDDGTVWSWGNGEDGRLGHGDENWQFLPRRIESLTNVIDISTGYSHSLALLYNGTIKAWGSGVFGQLGTGHSDYQYREYFPVDVSIATQVKKVVACFRHSLFITKQNELMTTGSNSHGALCMGNEDRGRDAPELIFNSSSYTITQASCGKNYIIFLTEEGDVYSCGERLGRPYDTIPYHTPGKVEGLAKVRSIAGSHWPIAFAVDYDNFLFSWKDESKNATRTSATDGYKVINVYAGGSHYFITISRSYPLFLYIFIAVFVLVGITAFSKWWTIKRNRKNANSLLNSMSENSSPNLLVVEGEE
ncbi:hypothetical protein P9112_009573 [Eukaryota sp. TZLM1-RC]